MSASILVTGGAGYIGSHTVVELINAGYDIVVADNFSNSQSFIIERISRITGKTFSFYRVDLADKTETRKIFSENDIAAVIHFAAYKSVAESVAMPLKYFHNNLYSLINLLEVMEEFECGKIVFSSSATVYGEPAVLPVTELSPFQKSLSAYGSTKQMGEEILEKSSLAGKIDGIALRYFNPVGAHTSGLIGELPIGIPNNLFPFVMQTAAGKLHQLVVFGNDYNTPDGSCIRDYVHVVDLAQAHVLACNRLLGKNGNNGFEVFNLGTGTGYSVLEIIKSFENVTGIKINYSIGNRRSGDAPVIYADASKAKALLQWQNNFGLDEMIRSAWAWECSLKNAAAGIL